MNQSTEAFYQNANQVLSPSEPLSKVAPAMTEIKAAVLQDEGYAWSWQCNIAMSFLTATPESDDENVRATNSLMANLGAAVFMSTAFDVDMRSKPVFQNWMKEFSANNAAVMQNFWEGEQKRLSAFASDEYIAKERKFYFGE